MKLPRDLSGIEFVKLLSVLEYNVTRQTGSHIRLTTQLNGEHHITIPNHNPIKVGTLSNILKDIADHVELSKEELNEKIFN